jgi:hypothetical protein
MLHLLYLVTAQFSLLVIEVPYSLKVLWPAYYKVGVDIYISFTQLSTAIQNFQGLVGSSILPRYLETCVKLSHSTVITSDNQLEVTQLNCPNSG